MLTEMAMGASTTVILIVAILGGAALLYLARGRSAVAPRPDPMPEPVPDDPARALFAAAGDEPPTEDQIAQARLGGSRGNPKLGAAPMTPQTAKNTPPVIDDGHVA